MVIDEGKQRNLPASGVHGLLTRDGISPAELVTLGRAEVEGYGGGIMEARVASVSGEVGNFRLKTDDGQTFSARRLLIATGLVDELPEIPGLRELWGKDVLHNCPYCYGYEVRDRPIGVLNTQSGVHFAQILRQWSADVTLFLHTGPQPSAEELEQLTAREISVVEGEVVGLEREAGRLQGVRLADGAVVPCPMLALRPNLVARADFLPGIGLTPSEHELGVGFHLKADPLTGATSVPGVWAAGNVAELGISVVGSMSMGEDAAKFINGELVDEDIQISLKRD
jgi:thioredoxin reductase